MPTTLSKVSIELTHLSGTGNTFMTLSSFAWTNFLRAASAVVATPLFHPLKVHLQFLCTATKRWPKHWLCPPASYEHKHRFGRKSYFIIISPYIGVAKYVNFLLCFNRSATGKMSVLTVWSFHGFHEIVDLIWYLPVKFMFLYKINLFVNTMKWSHSQYRHFACSRSVETQ